MRSTVQRSHSRFRDDEGGAVAIIFGVTSFLLFFVIGMAVDYGRAFKVNTHFANAIDAAAIAGAKALREKGLTVGEIETLAKAYFTENSKGDLEAASLDSVTVTVDDDKGAVTLDVVGNVPTAFLRIFGYETIAISKSATAVFDLKDIELGLSLNVTGSMCDPCSKIDALKAATVDLIDVLIPKGKLPNKVRIGMAPFAAGVNAGTYAANVSASLSANGCVYERFTGDRTMDEAPAAGRLSVAGDPGVTPNAADPCPTASPVIALSADRDLLKTAALNLTTSGSTAGHLGTSWAWYLVSPKWAGIWPASSDPVAYGNKKTIKAVLLMTDGVYNTFGGSYGWAQGNHAEADARQLCQHMKDEKIIVYSVGFQLPSFKAEKVLKDCASSTTRFFKAENEEQLRSAFREIGAQLSNLRLAN